ncbi:MAG: SRPBCC family protein [Terricaulis sp.]
MTKRSTTHATFVIEREYSHPPAKVFAAFADAKQKIKWFGGPDNWDKSNYQLDFRVGGKESISGGPQGGTVHAYDATIWDIVENERIVLAYDLLLDSVRISVSLATTEIKPSGNGTRLIYTEQGVYLDGYDDAGQREEGTQQLFNQLEAFLNT